MLTLAPRDFCQHRVAGGVSVRRRAKYPGSWIPPARANPERVQKWVARRTSWGRRGARFQEGVAPCAEVIQDAGRPHSHRADPFPRERRAPAFPVARWRLNQRRTDTPPTRGRPIHSAQRAANGCRHAPYRAYAPPRHAFPAARASGCAPAAGVGRGGAYAIRGVWEPKS
jgi:hypothetical protein